MLKMTIIFLEPILQPDLEICIGRFKKIGSLLGNPMPKRVLKKLHYCARNLLLKTASGLAHFYSNKKSFTL